MEEEGEGPGKGPLPRVQVQEEGLARLLEEPPGQGGLSRVRGAQEEEHLDPSVPFARLA